MLCDNGTYFVGNERQQRELVVTLDKKKDREDCWDKGIKWKFILPIGPHFSAVHETMIKSENKSIRALLGNAVMNDKELMIAFNGAKDFLNSRPITYQTTNPVDDLPLTPNHFLHRRIG